MASSLGDINSGTTATDVPLRIVTKAGKEETQVPVPPTHICNYVPGPGAAL